jgi:branched-chain amino acid transport system substrate-binding protein
MNKWFLTLGVAAVVAAPFAARAEDMTGVTATEIRIGNTMPYSGPAAPYGTAGKAMAAYIDTVNRAGGVAGHKIVFISRDDGYNPAKTVEQTRKLIEEDKVSFIYGGLGTAPSLSVRKYLNEHHVPQLGVASGAGAWNDPGHFPYSMNAIPFYSIDGRMTAAYILKHKPDAKIAVLYQNDDFGRDHLTGLKQGLGDKSGLIVKTASFEVADPTVDSQIIELRASGADTLYLAGIGKAMAQAIRKADELGWKPLRFLSYTASPVSATLIPAGLQRSTGIVSHNYGKDPQDPTWKDDAYIKDYIAWMQKDYPNPDIKNGYIAAGYGSAYTLVDFLKFCDGNFSREHIMYVVTHLKNYAPPGLLPGLTINTSPTDYAGYNAMRDMEFNGERWVLLPSDRNM